LSHTASPFCSGYFGDMVFKTISPGWPHTSILLISASQIVRNIGVSHQHPDQIFIVCVVLGFELRALTLNHATSSFL
jgi:hypothetical protein